MSGVGAHNAWLVFQAFTGADDDAGGQVDAWTAITGLVSAHVAALPARFALEAGMLATERAVRIETAYRDDLPAERREVRAVTQPAGPIYLLRGALRDLEGRRIRLQGEAVEVPA